MANTNARPCGCGPCTDAACTCGCQKPTAIVPVVCPCGEACPCGDDCDCQTS